MQNDYYWQDQESLPEPRSQSSIWIVLLLFLLLLVCSAASVLVPGGLGFLAGYGQLQSLNHENAIQHFQRGLGYLAENYPELAYTEFETALRFDGSYEPAREKLVELEGSLSGSTNPGAEDQNRVAAALFDEARGFAAGKRWSEAISRLEQLRALNPNFRPTETEGVLYQAYVASGYEAKAAGQIELARERFDAALVIRNNESELQRQREFAVLYLDGQQAFGYDWKLAIEKFQALYQLDPTYPDAKQRLSDAHVRYGDLAMRQNAACLAAREYDSALALTKDSQLTEKRSQAMAVCRQVVLVTPTPTLLPGTEYYIPRISTSTPRACNTGTGDVSGVVRDPSGQPLQNVLVAYYADGVNRVTARTNGSGQYQFIWGADAGLFHVLILGADGKTPAGATADIQYPGASKPGCHVVVDWQKM